MECKLDVFLANGRYGKIYLAHSREIQDFVVKKIDLISLTRDDKVLIQKEVEINKQLSSPYIVKFYDSYSSNGYLFIHMEYCDSADLDMHISLCMQEARYFLQNDILHWTYQVLQALDHMHQQKIVHRDIKPENILLHRDGSDLVCKVADFGLSWQLKDAADRCLTFTGSPIYMAPEVIRSDPYNHLVDLWSLGCVILELCNLRQPFDYEEIDDVIFHIMNDPVPSISDHYTHDMTLLVSQLLIKDPARRPEAKTVLSNKLFIKYRIKETQKFLSPLKSGPYPFRSPEHKPSLPSYVSPSSLTAQLQQPHAQQNPTPSSSPGAALPSHHPLPSAVASTSAYSSPSAPSHLVSTPPRTISGIPAANSSDTLEAHGHSGDGGEASTASPSFSPPLQRTNLSKITYVHSQYSLRKKSTSVSPDSSGNASNNQEMSQRSVARKPSQRSLKFRTPKSVGLSKGKSFTTSKSTSLSSAARSTRVVDRGVPSAIRMKTAATRLHRNQGFLSPQPTPSSTVSKSRYLSSASPTLFAQTSYGPRSHPTVAKPVGTPKSSAQHSLHTARHSNAFPASAAAATTPSSARRNVHPLGSPSVIPRRSIKKAVSMTSSAVGAATGVVSRSKPRASKTSSTSKRTVVVPSKTLKKTLSLTGAGRFTGSSTKGSLLSIPSRLKKGESGDHLRRRSKLTT